MKDTTLTLPGEERTWSSTTEAGRMLSWLYRVKGECMESLRYANFAHVTALWAGSYSPDELAGLVYMKATMQEAIRLKRLKEPEDRAEDERLRRELENGQR